MQMDELRIMLNRSRGRSRDDQEKRKEPFELPPLHTLRQN